jgi:short-subunit dehydrogenase
MDPTGKVILITGASSGIGAETAVAAGHAGMRVALAARRVDRLTEMAERVRQAGGQALVVPADISDGAQARTMVQRTLEHFGTIDVLFANAGFGYFGPTLSDEATELAVWQTNYFGTLRCIREVLPIMRARKSGHILVCSSVVARTGLPYYSAYAATKAAEDAFIRSLQLELEPAGIVVSGVYPGGTKTEWSKNVARHSRRDAVKENTPSMFMDSPERVARAVIRCINRPKPEVWPSRPSHVMTAIWTMFPRFRRWCFRRHARWARKTLDHG